MSITIGQIAHKAGVSKTTVSRVINDKPDVSPATRQRVLQLIAEYDFHPNVFAKAISQQRSHNLGLLIPHEAEYIFSNQFYVDVMHGVSTATDRLGYFLVLCYPHERNYLDIYKQKRVDGFILLSPGSFHHGLIASLQEGDVPFVSTARVHGETDLVYVDVDNAAGAEIAVEHLVTLDHRRIGFVGKPTLTSSLDRLNGYKAVLGRHNLTIDPRLIMTADSASTASGYRATQDLLALPEPPTAIFLVNDVMALGAMTAIQQRGRRVPDDMSVIGFDDIPLAQFASPRLTTVRQPAFEKGVRAAELLIHALTTGDKPEPEILDVELVVRESTGRLPIAYALQGSG
jgi:LacI family transcriptional regulator